MDIKVIAKNKVTPGSKLALWDNACQLKIEVARERLQIFPA
jgi:hypothetical protein